MIEVLTVLSCNSCKISYSKNLTKQDTLNIAKNEGWLIIPKQHLCPKCNVDQHSPKLKELAKRVANLQFVEIEHKLPGFIVHIEWVWDFRVSSTWEDFQDLNLEINNIEIVYITQDVSRFLEILPDKEAFLFSLVELYMAEGDQPYGRLLNKELKTHLKQIRNILERDYSPEELAAYRRIL